MLPAIRFFLSAAWHEERGRKILLRSPEMMLLLQDLPRLVIVQVHGMAAAAGCQLWRPVT
jgi:enoyl-CoA hydratase/carnithine racemase